MRFIKILEKESQEEDDYGDFLINLENFLALEVGSERHLGQGQMGEIFIKTHKAGIPVECNEFIFELFEKFLKDNTQTIFTFFRF